MVTEMIWNNSHYYECNFVGRKGKNYKARLIHSSNKNIFEVSTMKEGNKENLIYYSSNRIPRMSKEEFVKGIVWFQQFYEVERKKS